MSGDLGVRLTEEIFDEILLDGAGDHVTEDNDRGSDLSKAEVLDTGCESVVGVECPGGDLTRNLAVGQLLGVEDGVGPVGSGLVEDALVEDVVVAEESIGATITKLSANNNQGLLS